MISIIQLVAKCRPREWQILLELSPLASRGSEQGLWIDPVAFIQVLNGWELAKLPGPGAPEIYWDESVLLTPLVAAAWRHEESDSTWSWPSS